MAKNLKPANIALLSPKKQDLMFLRPITTLNTYEGASETFDPNGLFSSETFGRVGDKIRMARFSYIDLKLTVLHPHVFRNLGALKTLYTEILSGMTYAEWNEKNKDFEVSDPEEGETGYSFFMSHWQEFTAPETGSLKRKSVLEMISNNKLESQIQYAMVLPAGMRELEEKDGRPTEDEINGMYRKLFAVSQTVNDRVKPNDPINDAVRYQLQKALNEIYFNLFERYDGKTGFIQSRMLARSIWHSTRNVITAMDTGAGNLFAPNSPKPTDYALGLFQYVHASLPKFMYLFRTKLLSNKTWGLKYGTLIDKKTLKPTEVQLTPKNASLFGSEEGLERLAHRFESLKWRNEKATIQGHYLKLICDLGETFYLLDSIDDVKEETHRPSVRPMTWGEVFYYVVYIESKTTPVNSTRYPISEEGSSVLTRTSVRTTSPGRMIEEVLGVDENGVYQTVIYPHWPLKDSMIWMESSQPHPTRHKGYNSDHDGDVLASSVSMATEVKEECENYYNSWDSLYGSNGELAIDFEMDVSEWTIIGATAKNVKE